MVELTNDFQASADTFKYDEEITVTANQFGWQYDYRNSGVTLKVDGVSTGKWHPGGPHRKDGATPLSRAATSSTPVRLRSGQTDAVPGYDNFSWSSNAIELSDGNFACVLQHLHRLGIGRSPSTTARGRRTPSGRPRAS